MHDIRPYLPQLFNEPGSLLYVGARPDAHSWLPQLHEAGHIITVLEVWPENVKGLIEDTRIKVLIQGDIRQVDDLFGNAFDYIFWWHGPEHLSYDEIQPTLTKLESLTTKLVTVACPFGYYSQGPHKGNPYETHLTTLYPVNFEEWGYEVRTDGVKDVAGSEIVAWKVIK